MTIDEMKAVLAQVKYKNFEFVILQPAFGLLLQARYFEEDIVTGKSELQYTRKWHLSQFMTKSELVQTALKLCLTAAEHEVRENFVYRDKRIFGPHFDVDKLHEMCSDKCLDVRPAAQTAGVPEEGPFGLALNVRHKKCHEAADAFWTYWNENGETHRHGYYESTWGAINAAIKLVGVVPHTYGGQIAAAPQPVAEQVGEFSAVEQLSELLRGLEAGPACGTWPPYVLHEMGRAIAEQAKRAAQSQAAQAKGGDK